MITMDNRLRSVLERALNNTAPSREECEMMLDYAPASIEASLLRGVADAISRKRFGNEAIILGQIGVDIAACPGGCKFCTFGEGHTQFQPQTMTKEEILEQAGRFTNSGDLYALFIMTMHTFDFDGLAETIVYLRARMPEKPQVVVNIGDFDAAQARILREVGVNGAYHVCRLREGVDTQLTPENRKHTIRAIKDAGLDWYYCCEPVGPEHTSRELVEQMFLGVEYGCFQHAAMRRVYVPGSPLAEHGQISELRLAQVTAVVALASLACPDTKNIAVHEPNLIGLTSGANVVYAESGANPRDTEKETTGHRGRDIAACKTMLYEAGFDQLRIALDEYRPLCQTFRE